MRQFALCTILLLLSCSVKKEGVEESNNSADTVALTPSNSEITESGQAMTQIDFTLDSLLKFDSEAALIAAFGDEVKRSVGYYPEGMGEYQNTLLFPETANQVEFVWLDDSVTFSGLAYINITGQGTAWKTQEGISLGTNLKELEKLNGKPFTFYGFGWDYGGAVTWEDGHLQERKIFVSLEYEAESMPAEFEGLLGDHEVRSDSELAQKANPIVVEITMRR